MGVIHRLAVGLFGYIPTGVEDGGSPRQPPEQNGVRRGELLHCRTVVKAAQTSMWLKDYQSLLKES